MNWFVLCFTLLCLAYAAALLHEHGLLRPLVAATLGICRRRARGEALVLLLLVFWAVKVGGSKPDPGAPQGGQQQVQAPTSGVGATNTVQEQQGTDQVSASTNSTSAASSSNQVASATNTAAEVASSNVVTVASNSTPVVSSSNQVVVATNAPPAASSSNQVASSTNASSEAASSNVVAVASNSMPVVSSSNEVVVATNSEAAASSSNQVASSTNTSTEAASSNEVAVSSNSVLAVSSSNQVAVATNAAPVGQVPDQDVGSGRDRSPAQLRGMESNTAVWQSYAGPVWPFDEFTSNAIAGMSATEHPPIPDAMLASGLALYRVTTNTSLMVADSNCVPIRAWLRHGADNRGVSVDTPFPVTVGTGTYSRIGILANGRLAFGYATYLRQPTGDLPFATSYPVVTIAPFWGPFSLLPSAGSVAWTQTVSTDRFVVCWQNLLQDGDAARPASVQCEIRRDGSVRFVYGSLAEGSATASTVGVQNMGEGWSYSHGHTNRVMEGMTVTLRPVGVDGWADADSDGDGLSNFDEFMLGTDPLLADTDGDGPSDYWEVTHGFDPLVPQLGEPEPDSDGDRVPDSWENWLWTDLYNPASGPEYFLDPDGDGFVSWYEWYVLSSDPSSASSPGPPDADHTDVIANIVSSRPCVLRLERTGQTFANLAASRMSLLRLDGEPQVIEIPWMPGLSPAQLRLRLARGQSYLATLSRVPDSTTFPSDGFWWSNLSFSPAPDLDDLGLPPTTTGGIISYFVGSVALQTPDRGGDFWAVLGQATAATNNLAAWRIEIVKPDPFCACSTSNEIYLTAGSLVGGPVEWSGLPPGVVRTGNPLVFDPSSVTPAHYTVTAWAASNHLVSAQTEVDICHVGFAQSTVWLSADDYSLYDIALSGDTYVLNGILVWSEPAGIYDLSFVPAGLEPGVYTVHAWDGMCGVAELTANVVRVRITEPNGDPIGDDQFVFQGLAGNRYCEVPVLGTTFVSSQDANLVWGVDTIPDTTLSSVPAPAKGPSVTYTYSGEPVNNSDFAPTRQLTLSHALLPGCQDTANLHFFFDAELGSIHGTGVNWFVYWKQDGVVADLQTFRYANTVPGPVCELAYYDTNSDTCYITDDAYRLGGHASYTVTNGTGAVATIGLDLGAGYGSTNRLKAVAAVCAHELKHKEIHGWLVADPVDTDGDGVPDAKEIALGLNPTNRDTYNLAGAIDPSYAKYGDDEFLARQAETNFGAIFPSRDWSADGCNWRK